MDPAFETPAFDYEDILTGDVLKESEIDAILRGFTPTDVGPRAPFTADADPAQRAFIASTSATIRLLAPAGSGKTQSIANRVARCVSEGLRPARLLLLTFDNAARVTLAGRIDELLAGIGCRTPPPVLTLNVRQAVREKVAPSQFLAEMGVGDGRERRAKVH
jgi:hypothetical protein